MNKLKRLFLYAGQEKEDYDDVKMNIAESNRKILCMITLITTLGMMLMFILSFFIEILKSSCLAYLVSMIISFVIFIVAFRCGRGRRILTNILMYFFSEEILLTGIALGTYVEPTQASISFCVLMFAVPLIFTDIPLKSCSLILFSIALYIIGAHYTQTAEMFEFNLSAVIPYGVISIIINILLMKTKVNSYVLEIINIKLGTTDQLTGLLNRRSFDEKIKEIKNDEEKDGIKICAFDVNGLKRVNDNMGHNAGDELICGAAKAILDAFQAYGTCYRTGGDEFMAILELPSPSVDELKQKLESNTDSFKGELVDKLSISVGIVISEKGSKVSDLLIQADKAMYSAKNEYYKKYGIERRKA